MLAFGDKHAIRVFDAASFVELVAFCGHSSYVISLAFTPDGESIISGGYDCTLCLWRVDGFAPVSKSGPLPMKIEHVALSPDGRSVAAFGYDRTVWLFGIEGADAGLVGVD